MSLQDRRKMRREARRAAAAPASTRKPRRSPLRRALFLGASLSLLVAWMAASPRPTFAAGVPAVPEIDPGSMAGAMTLLVGGVLSLTDRLRRA